MKRQAMTGQWDKIKVLPEGKKPLRFGNGSVQGSESFILLPQQVGSRRILLGIYTLMAERAPILMGVKTLTKLGAIIDVQGGWLILTRVNPDIQIPLYRNRSGHLVVNLTQDWMAQGQHLDFGESSVAAVHMAQQPDVGQSVGVEMQVEIVTCHEIEQLKFVGINATPDSMDTTDVIMMNSLHVQGGQHEVDQVLQCCEDACVMMFDEDGIPCDLSSSQAMRNRVLSNLASRSRSRLRCDHGAQEEEEDRRRRDRQADEVETFSEEKYDYGRAQGIDPTAIKQKPKQGEGA